MVLEALGRLPRPSGGTLDALRGDLTLNSPEIRQLWRKNKAYSTKCPKRFHVRIFEPWVALKDLWLLPRPSGGTVDALRGDLALNNPEICQLWRKNKAYSTKYQKRFHGLIFEPWVALKDLWWLPLPSGGTLDALREI